MAILLRSDGGSVERDVLLFGSGTIGGVVLQHLCARKVGARCRVDVPWNVPSGRARALDEMGRTLDGRGRPLPVSIIWAAGKAGFSASDDEAADELACFQDVVDLAKGLFERVPDPSHRFHMISSAGGLYEGRAVRSRDDPPAPMRSYGRLKLAQERLAVTRLSRSRVSIYRPSSVYAVPGQGGRLGLIGALVHNGIAQRPSTIVGALDTLRDYVFARDVGAYVAAQALWGREERDNVHMLVSGLPVSIHRVIRTVESVTRRRLYLRIAESWNAHDITFSPAVKASRFDATPLDVGTRMAYRGALGRTAAAVH